MTLPGSIQLDARYVVAVTGTSGAVTDAQLYALEGLLAEAGLLRHGCCIGADAAAHRIARERGIPVEGFPGCDRRGLSPKRADLSGFSTLHEPRWYLDRNEAIVAPPCARLIAVVRSARPYRSGEWATIRRAQVGGVLTLLVPPDGSIARPDF